MDTIEKLETYYGKDAYIRDIFEGYDPEIPEALLKYTELAHTGGMFLCVADPEAVDTPMASPEVLALSLALARSGTEFYVGKGDYLIGTYGPGWIIWGLGCPLASASCATYLDSSLLNK